VRALALQCEAYRAQYLSEESHHPYLLRSACYATAHYQASHNTSSLM
jgi:hypothetical protein